MQEHEYLNILRQAGKLKTTLRHCWTAPDRRESVAEHSWRLALMAMLLSDEPEFASVDMQKVIRMCLVHDLGESFTGDIPVFDKRESDRDTESEQFDRWIASFPQPQRETWSALLAEMRALETREARIYKALDKLEALIAHDESDISTWLPLEYDLQMTYGQAEADCMPFLRRLRDAINDWTREKTDGACE